jgi:GDP-mannose transporter
MGVVTNSGVGAAIAYYGVCSSTLLIINKVSLYIIPAPVLLLSLQLWFAVGLVYLLRGLRVVDTQPLRRATAVKFSPVVVSFLCTLYANAKVLQYSNVETFITFRSSTPLILCVCDFLFLGRHLPSLRSVACLVALLVSSLGYVLVDHAFDIRAYSWLAMWFVSFTAYEVFVKGICDTVALDNWTRVIYTNAMAGALLAPAIPMSGKEIIAVHDVTWNASNILVLIASCFIGVGVSHSAYVLRSACSATFSAIVGILCKVFTVLINMLVWDKHASIAELACLLLGLIAGALYEQAPMREDSNRRAGQDHACVGRAEGSEGAIASILPSGGRKCSISGTTV